MIRLVLADDHDVVRTGLRLLLEVEPDFKVIGEAEDGETALSVVARLEPDVLVLDLVMPGLGGMEVARRVRSGHRGTRVVILSMHADEHYVADALASGADGYVLKRSTGAHLASAIRAAVRGERYLSPPLSAQRLEAYLSRAGSTAALDPLERLTAREHEVLSLAAQGRSLNDIAEQLGISRWTAESHRRNLMGKLGLHSQTELVRFALDRGVIG